MKSFNKDNKDFVELMEDWWVDEDRKFKQGQRLILAHEFKRPYRRLISMLSICMGKKRAPISNGMATHGLYSGKK
jgi:hypothetical protein